MAEPSQTTTMAHRVAQALAELPSVRVAYLFGSRAKGTARPDSDLDVAVYFDPQLDDLGRGEAKLDAISALTNALGSLGEKADVVDLTRASSALGFRVLREGVRVLERDPVERVRLEAHIARRYDDDRPRRALFRAAARRTTHPSPSDPAHG